MSGPLSAHPRGKRGLEIGLQSFQLSSKKDAKGTVSTGPDREVSTRWL